MSCSWWIHQRRLLCAESQIFIPSNICGNAALNICAWPNAMAFRCWMGRPLQSSCCARCWNAVSECHPINLKYWSTVNRFQPTDSTYQTVERTLLAYWSLSEAGQIPTTIRSQVKVETRSDSTIAFLPAWLEKPQAFLKI